MADDEAVVLECTSLVFCALNVLVNKTEKKTTHRVGERPSEKRKTFGRYNSLLMSDLMNHKTIWSNYMCIDIELFGFRNFLIMHYISYIIIYYFRFQITN